MKKLSALLIAATLVASPAARAEGTTVEQCKADCKKALDAADAHIVDLNLEIMALTNESDALLEHLELANKANVELVERSNAWYRDPLIMGSVAFALGLVVGAVLVPKAAR